MTELRFNGGDCLEKKSLVSDATGNSYDIASERKFLNTDASLYYFVFNDTFKYLTYSKNYISLLFLEK